MMQRLGSCRRHLTLHRNAHELLSEPPRLASPHVDPGRLSRPCRRRRSRGRSRSHGSRRRYDGACGGGGCGCYCVRSCCGDGGGGGYCARRRGHSRNDGARLSLFTRRAAVLASKLNALVKVILTMSLVKEKEQQQQKLLYCR